MEVGEGGRERGTHAAGGRGEATGQKVGISVRTCVCLFFLQGREK